MIRPMNDWILVRYDPDEDNERTLDSGVIIPAGSYRDEDIHQWGTVVRVGPGKWDGHKRKKLEVKPGDKVLFIRFLKNTHTGETLRAQHAIGENEFLIKESDILVIQEAHKS